MTTVSVSGLTGDSIISHFKRAMATVEEIESYDNLDSLTLDLTDNKWFTPVFLTPVSVALNRLNARGTDVEVRKPRNHGSQIYLNQIGFPFGYDNPQQQYQHHLPICRLNTNARKDAIDIIGGELHRIIRQHFSDLNMARIQGITLPIDEVVDNVDQHSRCDHGAILIQQYETKGLLDICIVDDGVSIPRNFEQHDKNFDDDYDALSKAATGQISTRGDVGHRARGYGMKMMSRIITEGLDGKVLISSRNANRFQIGNKEPFPVLGDNAWDGTLIIGRMNIPEEGFTANEFY